MALKVKNNQVSPSENRARAAELAYKTLVASSQQKTFEMVLNQFQGAGRGSHGSEINSLQAEINHMQVLQSGAPAGKVSTPALGGQLPQSGSGTGMNALAASALLKLAALSTKGESFRNTCLETMSAAAAAESQHLAAMDRRTAPLCDSTRVTGGIGSLSARFESGEQGVDVIGYDGTGGTSYGTYQIASRPGTMKSFINYLEDRAPDLAKRLRGVGPANTGSRRGAMPSEWKRIAAEDPNRFAQLQHDFIAQTHYSPAAQDIFERTGVDVNKHSRALKEVLWSTAVQHGPRGAANIFCKALNRSSGTGSAGQLKDLINNVYSSRSRQFGQSTSEVQNAVQGRFREERAMALAMLADERPASRFEA